MSDGHRELIAGWVAASSWGAGHIVLGATVLTVFLAAYTVQYLGVNTSTSDMISSDVPFRRDYVAYKSAFPVLNDNIVVVLGGATPDRRDAAADALAASLATDVTLFPYVYQPGGGRFFRQNGLLYLDVDALSLLSDRLAMVAPQLAVLNENPSLGGFLGVLTMALGQPQSPSNFGLDGIFDRIADAVEAQLAGREGALSWRDMMMVEAEHQGMSRHRFILVRPNADFGRLRPGREAMARIRAEFGALPPELRQGVELRLTGSLALEDEELQSAMGGAQRAGVLSLGLVGVLLVIGLRSVRLVTATLLTLIAGLIWTAGFATVAVGHLNLISVAFAVLFVGLGIDFGIHFGLRFQESRDRGEELSTALRSTGHDVGGSLTLCAVAAAIGFCSFLPTDFAGLAELGLISGGGMFIALVANFTLLPAILTFLPPRPSVERPKYDTFSALDRFARRFPKLIPATAAVVAFAALSVAPNAEFDFNPLNLKDPESESVSTALELMADTTTAPYTIGVTGADLEQARQLAERLARLDAVDHAITLADFVPGGQPEKLELLRDTSLFLLPVLRGSANRVETDDKARAAAFGAFHDRLSQWLVGLPADGSAYPSARRLFESLAEFRRRETDMTAALAALEMRLLGGLPEIIVRLREAFKAQPVTLTEIPEELRARMLAEDGRARVQVFPAENVRDNAALTRFVYAVRSVAPHATDDPVLIVEAGKSVVGAVLIAAVIALLSIVLLLALLLRTVWDCLLVLLPLALAAVTTIALAVLIDLPFNFANVIVLPLLLGLGVANGVHLVLRRRGAAGDNVMRTSTPRAVFFSALTTIASFGSLAFSTHPGTASMGTLLLIGLGMTLVSTLIALPALLLRRGAT